MEEKFKVEIINPEKVVFSSSSEMVTLPAYEGDMDILKQHIPIITFLRPGIIRIKKENNNYEEFFVEDGIVEFYKDSLSVLSTTAIDINNLSKNYLENLTGNIAEQLKRNNLTDSDRYSLNHKLDVIKNINV